MTLQDDIARYASCNRPTKTFDGTEPIIKRIASGLEREHYLVNLADLPGVDNDSGVAVKGGRCYATSAEGAWENVKAFAALARHHEACEAEAAVLVRRRDELARELSDDEAYAYRFTDATLRVAIDRLISAEAEIAHLKKGGGRYSR